MLEKEFCKSVGGAIRNLRIERGFSNLTEFALRNNIPSSTLSRIEIGENEAQLHNLKKISDGLGLSLAAMFQHIEQTIAK